MPYQVHSEPSGGHWLAWVTADGESKPAGSVTLVGKTREEAEANAQEWAARLERDPQLRR